MKNILALIHDDGGQEARFQAALDVTRVLNGHLTCIDISIMPVLTGDPFGAGADVILIADERQREASNRDRLEARLAREDISWNWIDAFGNLGSCVASAARLADLVVVNRQLAGRFGPDMRGLISNVLAHIKKPILAVPDSDLGFDACGRVIIAWDGSIAASSALCAAVPLLTCATGVFILEVDDDALESSADEAASYLSRYGIHPVIRRVPLRQGVNVAATIIAEAKAETAAFVVMGGFGHSSIREAVFGGVSREMLTLCPVPIFMAQ